METNIKNGNVNKLNKKKVSFVESETKNQKNITEKQKITSVEYKGKLNIEKNQKSSKYSLRSNEVRFPFWISQYENRHKTLILRYKQPLYAYDKNGEGVTKFEKILDMKSSIPYITQENLRKNHWQYNIATNLREIREETIYLLNYCKCCGRCISQTIKNEEKMGKYDESDQIVQITESVHIMCHFFNKYPNSLHDPEGATMFFDLLTQLKELTNGYCCLTCEEFDQDRIKKYSTSKNSMI